MSDATNPTKPAVNSLEGKLAIAGTIIGAALSGLSVTFAMLEESFPDIGWLGAVAGMIAVAASVFGIAKSRGQVKAADIIATAAKSIAGAMGPSAGLNALGIPHATTATPPAPPPSVVAPNPPTPLR